MKFVVEFRLFPDSKAKVVEVFEAKGPNRTQGVNFRQAWVGTKSNIAFVVVESDSEQLVNDAAKAWGDYGGCIIHPVVDIEQF